MSVLIGGGTGFVGSALVKGLARKGYNYKIVSRKKLKGGSHMTWTDLEEQGLPFDCRAVVNVAGQNIFDIRERWTTAKNEVWASRVNTTRQLKIAIDKAKESDKPKVYIGMSGVGYYQPSQTEEYTEDSYGGNFDFLSNLSTAWEAESKFLASPKVRRVIIRSGVVLGREGGVVNQMYWPFFFGFGGPVGSGAQYFPWIHINDMVDLIIYCIENENVSGVLNGVAPQIITNKQFAQALGKAMWRPSMLPLPSFILKLAFSEERAKIMTEGQRVLPKRTLESGFKFKFNNIDDACKQCARMFYLGDP